jgi:hypothetical protein
MRKRKKQKVRVKGGKTMADVIDVHDLPDEDVQMVQHLVSFLREKSKKEKELPEKEEDVVETGPLGVKGTLSRKEIYDHL